MRRSCLRRTPLPPSISFPRMARHPSLTLSSSSSSKFVETALCTTGPLALSYVHHPLRWVIREHLHSLIKEFPSLRPSTDYFTHDDGTTVHLLNASGALPLPPSAVELTIWLHQNYPSAPPIVYLSSAYAAVVDRGHPFVSPSGAATTPYLETWQYPRSNLLDMARNLVNVFTLCPPFFDDVTPTKPPPPPRDVGGALASRREAMDRLYARLSTETAAFREQVEEDVVSLMSIQSELLERARAIDCALEALQREKESLRRLVADTEEGADVVRNWVRVYSAVPPARDDPGPEEVFDLEDDHDGRCRCFLDSEAAFHATDEVMWALDMALGSGAVPFDAYLRQVRALSREQFSFSHLAARSIAETKPAITYGSI